MGNFFRLHGVVHGDWSRRPDSSRDQPRTEFDSFPNDVPVYELPTSHFRCNVLRRLHFKSARREAHAHRRIGSHRAIRDTSGYRRERRRIIGFRAGWGLGNALFISTALAAIIGAASGGSGQAIILYETALGVGLAVGPLAGGALGSISWRMPFFGTAALMVIGLAAAIALLPKPTNTATKASLWAGFKALRRPQLLLLSTVALCYNFGFFTLLAYSPYPLEAAAKSVGVSFGAHELGLVFFGWGLALAFTSVLAAPRLTRRFGLLPVLSVNFAMFAACLITMAIGAQSLPTLVSTVVAAGLFLGVLNTALTEAVMEATDLPRSITSSTYSGVRFLGGAVAPLVTGPLAEMAGAGAPYCVATVAVLGSMAILVSGRRLFTDISRPHVTSQEEASAITAGDEV